MDKSPDYYKLDNPVRFSLSEVHHAYSVNYQDLKCYHPDYCPFGGFSTGADIAAQLDAYAALVDPFFIVGEKPALSRHLRLQQELVCLQMLPDSRISLVPQDAIIITSLTPAHADALFRLVNLVQPGYFKRKTALLGNYYGIFKHGVLLAAAGERMHMHDFVEVSAIVTHPDHTGQGYAKQLIQHVTNAIFDRGKVPYLHVVETNVGAIKLYEKLGFNTRRKISFWQITKSASQLQ